MEVDSHEEPQALRGGAVNKSLIGPYLIYPSHVMFSHTEYHDSLSKPSLFPSLYYYPLFLSNCVFFEKIYHKRIIKRMPLRDWRRAFSL